MSNNIYDILKKMQNLEAPKQSLTESKKSKPDYIDIDKDGDKKEPMKKAAREKSKGAVAEAVAQVEQQLAEKYQGFKNIDEDPLDFLRSPEGIAKNRADQARADQRFADRSAKHFAGQIGDQYHDQLMKNSPSYADEYRSRAKDMPYDKLDKLAKSLQAKHDPMGGPTNIDYEKIKKNPMATRAGEQGSDWRPWGPGPKDSFDSDKFGRPVKEGEVEESGLQAYLGKKKYGKEGMQALQKAGRDGASKEKMAKIRARHDKMDEDNSGTVPPKHYGGEGPTGAAFDLYMQQRKEQLAKQRPKNEDMLSPKQKKIARMSPPPNKIDASDLAKLRADKKGMKKEGNAFSGAVAKAKATGQDEFEIGGKEYEVQEGIEDILQNILPKSMQPFNNQTAAAASKAQAPVKEGTTQIKSLQRALYASMNAEANGQGEGGNDPEYMKYAAQIRDMIKKDFGRGADFLLGQASQGDGYADQYLMGARERGVDILTIEKLLDYDDGDESEYTDVDDMGIYRRPAPVKEGFPTVDDAKKRMDAKAGKTAHGTKTVTKTGVKHERNYDADEPTGERGRPKKDKFAK